MIHRNGVLDASAVLGMALLATSDVPMKRRWRPLEQRLVVRVANDTVCCLYAFDRRMTGIATTLQKRMRLREWAWIEQIA